MLADDEPDRAAGGLLQAAGSLGRSRCEESNTLTKSQVIPSLQGLTVSSLQRISKHKLGRLELPHFTDKVPIPAPIAQLVEQLTLNQ